MLSNGGTERLRKKKEKKKKKPSSLPNWQTFTSNVSAVPQNKEILRLSLYFPLQAAAKLNQSHRNIIATSSEVTLCSPQFQ
jgi:hypothetical protein